MYSFVTNKILRMKRIMRNFGWCFLLLFSTFTIAQTEVHFDESGYQSVLNRSKKEHKPIFYMVYATWCSHCNKMKKEVFKDSVVANFMNKNFVCAWQDFEKGEGEIFKNKYTIKSFPTFLFLDEKGTVIYHFNGEFKVTDFIAEAKNALIPEKQLPYLKKQFYDDSGNAAKCLTYLVALKKGSERADLNPHAQKYLATQSDSQLVSEMNWRIIANGVSDIQSKPFQYVLQHQKEFGTVASPVRVEKKIVNIVSELLKPYADGLDTINYYKNRPIAKTIQLQKTDSLIFTFDVQIAERTKNWSAYKKTTIESAEKYVWNDAKTLKEIAQNYLLYVADPSSLEYAFRWAKRAKELKESGDGYLLLAKLYQKTNDKGTATILANKAKNWSSAMGFSTKDADELLLQLSAK